MKPFTPKFKVGDKLCYKSIRGKLCVCVVLIVKNGSYTLDYGYSMIFTYPFFLLDSEVADVVLYDSPEGIWMRL